MAAGLWLRGESRPGQSPVRLDTQGWATVPGSPLAPSKLGPRPWPEKSVCQRQEPALSLGPARTVGLVPREDRKAGWWAVGGKARLLFPRLWAGPARPPRVSVIPAPHSATWRLGGAGSLRRAAASLEAGLHHIPRLSPQRPPNYFRARPEASSISCDIPAARPPRPRAWPEPGVQSRVLPDVSGSEPESHGLFPGCGLPGVVWGAPGGAGLAFCDHGGGGGRL